MTLHDVTPVWRNRISWVFIMLSMFCGIVLVQQTQHSMAAASIAQRQTEIFSSIVDTDDFAVIAVDDRGRIVLWNDGAAKLFGWTSKEIIGQEMYKLLPDDLVAMHKQLFARGPMSAAVRATYAHHTMRCVTKDKAGKPIDVLLNIRTLPQSENASMLVNIDSTVLHPESITTRQGITVAPMASPVTSANK